MIFFLLLLIGALGKSDGANGRPPLEKKGHVVIPPPEGEIPIECVDGLVTPSTPKDSWSMAYWLWNVAENEWQIRFGFAEKVFRRWVICLEPAGSRYVVSIWRQVPDRPVEFAYRSTASHRSRDWATGEGEIARQILAKGLDPERVDSPNNGLTSLKKQRQGPT